MATGVEVRMTGPLFDGTLEREVGLGLDEGREAVADRGVDLVRARLDQSVRNGTGYASSRVVRDVGRTSDTDVVHDLVIYGAWLEGTSSRNRTTRFKGYRSFRRARQELEAQAVALAEPHVARRVTRAG